MKHKTKVIILSIITAFLVLFAVLRVVSSVRADDTSTDKTFNVRFHYGSKDGTIMYDVQFSYTLPDGYYLVGVLNPITATDTSTQFFQLFSVNPPKYNYHEYP